MKFYPPNPTVFIIAVLLVLMGMLTHLGVGPVFGLRNIGEELSILGFVLLLFSTISESFQNLADPMFGKKQP